MKYQPTWRLAAFTKEGREHWGYSAPAEHVSLDKELRGMFMHSLTVRVDIFLTIDGLGAMQKVSSVTRDEAMRFWLDK